jgi:hypothetical protein
LIPDERSRRAVRVAEQYADGLSSNNELAAAHDRAESAHQEAFRTKGKVGSTAEWAAVYTTDPLPFHAARTVQWMAVHARFHDSGTLESTSQADLLRDIFGNPFRPASLDPAWLTWRDGTVPGLAQSIYEERAFERLPILADALEDAGCAGPDLLSHCRQPGIHVRGCWVVDLLLGKE